MPRAERRPSLADVKEQGQAQSVALHRILSVCFIKDSLNLRQIVICVRNIANVHTMSVDFLRILAHMGVEARENQYDKSESSHFLYNYIIKKI